MTVAYPLQWPAGWPRTPSGDRQDLYKFGSTDRRTWQRRLPTFASARDRLVEELARLPAQNVVISSNFVIASHGLPSGNRGTPDDEAIAVYFTLHRKPLVMACDRYRKAAGNLTSLALAIEAMRQLDRHGGGQMMERAFTGFAALPAAGPKWWEVLGVSPDATPDQIRVAYRDKAAARHPDRGGSEASMSELNVARDEALKARGRT